MAEAIVNPDRILENMKIVVIQVFEELYRYLAERRDFLLARLKKIHEDYHKNAQTAHAIGELTMMKEQMRSNLNEPMNQSFDERIRFLERSMVDSENLDFVGFRCYSEKIRRTINEIDLYELSSEYVGREHPVLTTCNKGRKDGELANPRGIALDKARNEVYVCDKSNCRIQVLSAVGEYVRQFGRDHLTEPYAICISQQDELFVTDSAKHCVLKFSLAGEFLKQVGSRGTEEGQFSGIRGLCCEAGLVYVCDGGIQRIQIFDSELNYVKYFGYRELIIPSDIHILSDTIYIISQDNNCIFCYNIDCTLQKKIELTGQEQLMTISNFFMIDKNGNFLISDSSHEQIRIFSPKGVLRHILSGHLPFLHGITIDNFDKIICVCHSKECFIKF